MRALIISKYFPPNQGAEELVSGKFAVALRDARVETHVIAGLRAGGRDASSTWTDIWPPTTHIPCGNDGVLDKLRNASARLHFNYYGDLDWWAVEAAGLGHDLLRDQSFDCIISRAWPEQSMVVAARLAETHSLPWLAFINDPIQGYFPPPYNTESPGIQAFVKRAWLRKIIPRIDRVVFPCQRLADFYFRMLRIEQTDQVAIVPHIGWRSAPLSGRPVAGGPQLYHIGNLSSHRASLRFFEAFRSVIRCCRKTGVTPVLHLVGKVCPEAVAMIDDLGLNDDVAVHSAVSYRESLRLMQQADALVLIEAEMSEGVFLPSKLCDYIVSGKPIVMYSPEVGAVADTVGGYEHPGFMGQTVNGATRSTMRLIEALCGFGAADDFIVDPTPFLARTVAGAVIAEIEALLH